ncbi:MAG: hypothetical protein K0S53_3066 [Bacteroidetes bacterium]|jgi:hypothetical protein|nr:hypothetical protein [Bacteroidota bacterium]MDF2453568.1 hypothetical protein [Bacteroidota bacterium]
MHRYLLYFFLVFSLFFCLSCNKDKFKAPESSFLVINPVELKTIAGQGENTHNITDIWYYVNGKFKGVFPVGSVMPIVASGNTEIILYAGIKNNGISATRLPYPLFNAVTIHQDIEAGKTYTFSPEFQYNSGAFFYYADDFQSFGTFFSSAGECDYINTSTYDPSKSYGGSGGSIYMKMTDAEPTSVMKQNTAYFLPGSGATVYLELNYKCNQPFEVGVLGSGSAERTAITVNTSEEWNKIYVQLTNVVSTQPVYPDYQVFIKARKSVESPEIYIDNVKLIFQ